MAYERTNWQNGDVISSEKLNKMEAGLEYACSLEHEVEDPTEGQVLKYDAEKGKFVNGDVAIETNIQNPTDGQTLKYDAASGKWVNGEGGSGKLVVNVTFNTETNVTTMDKTWQEIFDAFPNVVASWADDPYTIYGIINTMSVNDNNTDYVIEISGLGTFNTNSPNSYPRIGD